MEQNKRNITKHFVFVVLSFCIGIVFSQNTSIEYLKNKSFESLNILFDINKKDTVLSQKIARAYLLKANEGEKKEIAKAYFLLSKATRGEKSIQYIDSSFFFAKKHNKNTILSTLYMYKSDVFFDKEEYVNSLKNAILGYKSAKKCKNTYVQIKALQKISMINELWGDYKKSLETEKLTRKLLYSQPKIENFEELDLRSLEGMGKTYAKLSLPDSALYYFKKGIVMAKKNKDTSTYFAFVSRSGMALYNNRKYKQALDSLYKGDKNRKAFNNSYFPYFNYYVGSSLYGLGNKEKGISYLLKVDSVYKINKALYPELPLAYDKLATHFREQGNKTKEAEYLQKLVDIERTINVKRNEITNKTIAEYQIPELLDEKEGIIDDLTKKNYKTKKITWGILGGLFLSLLFLMYYVKRQKVYKKRFEELIAQQQKETKPITLTVNKEIEDESSGLPLDKIQQILDSLDEFESNNEFLKSDVSLSGLAKQIGSNTTYLSKVINLKKGTNFSGYINNLRVDYAVQELTGNSTFRRYTIKAIASEIGFKNTESFSKAFYKKYGIYPSFFIKQLESKN